MVFKKNGLYGASSKKISVRKGWDEGIIEEDYGGFLEKSIPNMLV